MRRLPMILALLLALILSVPSGLAQEATPATSPVATPQADLTGATQLPLDGGLRAEFEAYVSSMLQRLGVPGASVAVVQGGNIVYQQGFGVSELGSSQPVTPDTLMMIGSVNKSMTGMLAATLVDDGSLSWDTPLVQLLPNFAVSDPQLTPRLTVADSFCACTGLPRHDAELIFNFDSLTPGKLITSIAGYPLTTPFGQTFQYSNQMYAIGGYAAAVAAGAAPGDLWNGYRQAMRERLLTPMGMNRSTFVLDDVLASGDYAVPHGSDLDGTTRPLSPIADQLFSNSVAPAGGLWSSAREMAQYVQTELADGVAPSGTRVVSRENLERTWAPRVETPSPPGAPPVLAESSQHYAMGWETGTYRGLPIVSHNGGTLGFVSEVAFLPQSDLGVVILTNGGAMAGFLTYAVQFRLFELLYGQPAEFDALLGQYLDAQAGQLAQFQAQLRPVDPAAVTPYLGRYTNPALGDVSLDLSDGRLVMDGGEVRSELRPVVDQNGQVMAYIFVDAPLTSAETSVTLQQDASGKPEIVVNVQGEGAATYVFSFVAPPVTATPVP